MPELILSDLVHVSLVHHRGANKIDSFTRSIIIDIIICQCQQLSLA